VKLPNAGQVLINTRKLLDYVLSPGHSVGRFKAKFFAEFGFYSSNWAMLDGELRRLVLEEPAELDEQNAFGQKYLVRGIITGPGGRVANVVSVWIILNGEEIPRFITVFPGERT